MDTAWLTLYSVNLRKSIELRKRLSGKYSYSLQLRFAIFTLKRELFTETLHQETFSFQAIK